MLPGGGGHALTPALAGVKGGDVLPHGFTLHSGRAPQPHAGDCWPDHGWAPEPPRQGSAGTLGPLVVAHLKRGLFAKSCHKILSDSEDLSLNLKVGQVSPLDHPQRLQIETPKPRYRKIWKCNILLHSRTGCELKMNACWSHFERVWTGTGLNGHVYAKMLHFQYGVEWGSNGCVWVWTALNGYDRKTIRVII